MLLRIATTLHARVGSQLGQYTLKQGLLIPRVKNLPQNVRTGIRKYTREPYRSRAETETGTRQSIKDKLMGPPTENAYSMGKGALAGASVIGLAALCYYGVGLGHGQNIHGQSMLWPKYVRERIHTTYGYFGGACALTAASAFGVFQSPRLLSLVTRSGWLAVLGTFALVVGTGAIAQALPYSPGIGAKQLAWGLHCAVLGGVVAPICLLGGPLLTRAALYTAGVAGSLSTLAVCAPSDKFLYMGGPLAIGLGLVFASSLASMWLPPTTALGAGLASMSLYGGLIVFSGFLLYDTQRIVRQAEVYPEYATYPFDPINASLSIYMDVLNIFIRIAIILANGQNSSGGKRR